MRRAIPILHPTLRSHLLLLLLCFILLVTSFCDVALAAHATIHADTVYRSPIGNLVLQVHQPQKYNPEPLISPFIPVPLARTLLAVYSPPAA